jgi:hypothetical protein
MSLADKTWTPVSIHRLALVWLRAERDSNLAGRLALMPSLVWSHGINDLLDEPDLDNPDRNRARWRLFMVIRNIFYAEIPPDTEWYEVRSLTDDELQELRAVNFKGWTDPADKNELDKVAARKNIALTSEPATWEPPILFGHDKDGPFTIIEGNNRLTAYVGSGRKDLNIPLIVGLSKMKCMWHMFDVCDCFLAYDLWKGT